MMICLGGMLTWADLLVAVLVMILGKRMTDTLDKCFSVIPAEAVPKVAGGHGMLDRLQVSGTIFATGQTIVELFFLLWRVIVVVILAVGEERFANNTKFGLG